eukprot:g11364.t1
MAGKEAVVFLVDCNASMGGHMELARKAVRVLMVQKMLQSKQTEVGVVLFGLPESETANKLNDADSSDYLGVKEYCMLDKGSVPVLRRVEAIDVPGSENKEPAMGDLLDAMVVGMDAIRSRTLKKKFLRHVYLLTDAATPVQEASQLPEIVNMYTDATMECRLHFVSFGDADNAAEAASTIKEQNEKMLVSVAAATRGTVVPAQTVVDLIGDASIKTTNPVQTKVDLFLGTSLTLHCRYFKKTDTGSKESLKKESIGSYDAAGGSDGKVRVDKTYRDPEMPEVEVDFENQVKGFRYGQDYIPVNAVDEVSLKLPEEPPSLKVIGSTPSSTVRRHFYVDDTFVVVPEPGSGQAAGAIGSLTGALRNLGQVLVVRFVRRKGSEPWLAILIPDTTGVAPKPRLLLQKIPFIEDVRSFNFPSLAEPPPSRKPSEEQRRVSASLVDAMMMPDMDGAAGDVRAGLVLDPVRQGVTRAKVARAMDPECELPEPLAFIKAGVAPAPQLMESAASALEEYREAFVFEKRDNLKGAGKKRVAYFSDLTLAEPEEASVTNR